MSHKTSKIWSFALPLSLVVLGAAYYIRMPGVRAKVDAHTPVVRSLLGRFVEEPVQVIVQKGELDPLFTKPAPTRMPDVPPPPPRAPITRAPNPVALPEPPSSSPAPTAPDLQRLASDPTRWPKTVVLNKDATFPAVLNGKIVGSLVVPAGTETNVKAIKDDKIGLEFNGGGAWVPVDQTDLLARAQAPR